MFGVISYVGVAGIAAAVLSFLWIVSRPIHLRGELKSWQVFGTLFSVLLVSPYAAFEVMTRKFGPEMKSAVEAAMNDAAITGDTQYYKVIATDGKKATVIAIGEEKLSWGGMDRPAVRIKLEKNEKGKWKATSYSVIVSDNRNKDGIVFPPFW